MTCFSKPSPLRSGARLSEAHVWETWRARFARRIERRNPFRQTVTVHYMYLRNACPGRSLQVGLSLTPNSRPKNSKLKRVQAFAVPRKFGTTHPFRNFSLRPLAFS